MLIRYLLAIAFSAICGIAQAQTYPAKPIRLILPFAAGSPSDMVGRTIAQKMAAQMGQGIVPDNRASSGGVLGLTLFAKSPPDGYTILVSSPTIVLVMAGRSAPAASRKVSQTISSSSSVGPPSGSATATSFLQQAKKRVS